MNIRFVLATLAGAMLAASGAMAQTPEMYVTKTGDNWMLHGGTAPAAGSQVLASEGGAKPANCPEGSYWLNDQQMLASCTGPEVLGFAKVTPGQKTASGADFPADSYLVQQGGMSMTDVSK
jgi:hypothetical protein